MSTPAVTELPGATLRSLHVSAMDNVCYLLTDASSGAQLLIDAADDAPALLAMVGAGSSSGLEMLVTTHQHWDHHRALAAVVDATGARTASGVDDADAIPVPIGVRMSHGDVVRVGELSLDVVHLRGHTPGSVALIWRDAGGGTHAFTGDSLFPGGVGKTTSPQDFTSLLDDVSSRLFDVLPDDTIVYPGHGSGTTIGAERPQLAQWRERGW